MSEFPQKIRMLSDDTELEFIEQCFFEKKKSTDKLGRYVYTKAQTKLGLEVVLNKSQIDYLESCGLLEIIS